MHLFKRCIPIYFVLEVSCVFRETAMLAANTTPSLFVLEKKKQSTIWCSTTLNKHGRLRSHIIYTSFRSKLCYNMLRAIANTQKTNYEPTEKRILLPLSIKLSKQNCISAATLFVTINVSYLCTVRKLINPLYFFVHNKQIYTKRNGKRMLQKTKFYHIRPHCYFHYIFSLCEHYCIVSK